MIFKYKLCTFKIMSCIISTQTYNSRNIRLGDALGCSLTCPGQDHPQKSWYMFIYTVLKVFQWSGAFPGTLFQCLTVTKSSLVEVWYSGLFSCGSGKQTVPFMQSFLHICKLLRSLFVGANNTGSSVFQQKSYFRDTKSIFLLSSLPWITVLNLDPDEALPVLKPYSV